MTSPKVGDLFTEKDGGVFEIRSISPTGAIWAQSDSATYYAVRALTKEEFDKKIREGSITMGRRTTTGGAQDCSHNWRRYKGFNEVYDYCTGCDAKLEVSWKELK